MTKPKRNVLETPMEGQIKANFDATYSQQDITANAGIIIRNHERSVMGTCSYPLGMTRDPTIAEVKECLQAVIFWEEMGFQNQVVEGNALTVIKKIKSDLMDRSVIGNIIYEIQRRNHNFITLSFEHTPRKTNEAAHALASRRYNLDNPIYWVEEVPTEIEPIIVNDQRRL
ncbi:hypothetical protein CXB51_013838 [Gossypium anomalum]|uniref:RNase H type-1 domain-containing protein n=1 Tax=Gossypium anomalum TaxID=47600 RepID=A0A8J5YQG6_9ROSI|nr:hypothetical protein CXB51_013838 [Gossypium anomalum]